MVAGESQSGGASGRGSAPGASLDGGIDDEGAIQGKFGRGVACIGESEWWRRREPCGASRPTGVAGDTLPRCTRETARGSIGGKERSADLMDLCASPTPVSSDALLGAPQVAGIAGSRPDSGASGKAAAWRGSSASVPDGNLATVASATAAFGGERSSVALDFFPPARSGSAQVFSPCSPNKKGGARTQAHAEGGAAAGGDVADVGIVPRDAVRTDGTNAAISNENTAPPLLGDAWTDPPSSTSGISSRSRDAAPPAAESPAPSGAGGSVKHPRRTSGREITTVEASVFQQQSVLAPPSGIGGGARQGGAKPAVLDFLRGLPSSARAVGSGWHGRGGSREWRQEQQQQEQPQPQPQLQQRRRQSLRLVSRRRVSYLEGAPLRTQHPTLMSFWNGAQAQGGSSSESSGKAQGGGDRMATST